MQANLGLMFERKAKISCNGRRSVTKRQKTARLILREKRFETNMTRTDKAGSQQWTTVSLLLELISTV